MRMMTAKVKTMVEGEEDCSDGDNYGDKSRVMMWVSYLLLAW